MSAERERPNVIFILTDDQGPWAAGCYGNHEIRTPNLDRLAATGTRFDNFFITIPVCSPSRATYLTGRIPSQHGIHEWIPVTPDKPDDCDRMADEVAYTDVMAQHGYTCGLSGKWHMGNAFHPQHSFDFWYAHQKGGGDYNKAPMIRDGEGIIEDGYITDVITDEAIGYLDRHDGSQPFYLSVHYTAPHSPWIDQHPQDIVDSYDDCPFETCPQEPKHPWAISLTDNFLGNREGLKGYFAAVTAMDANVGRIIDRVEELGLRENTLICFFADNGFSCGHHGFWGKGNGTFPRNMYENSIKVPAIMSQPGVIPEDVGCDAMVSAYDFMPTLLDYLDLPVPEQQNLPGSSFLPVLMGEEESHNEAVVIYDEYGPVRMIYRHAHGPDELFDLVHDPDERVNLAYDDDYDEKRRELKAQMDEWFAKYVIPEKDGLKETSEMWR